jgi:hypothetical protein
MNRSLPAFWISVITVFLTFTSNLHAAAPAAVSNLQGAWIMRGIWSTEWQALLVWSASSEADYYRVFRYDPATSDWVVLANEVRDPVYFDRPPNAPPLQYAVAAVNADGQGSLTPVMIQNSGDGSWPFSFYHNPPENWDDGIWLRATSAGLTILLESLDRANALVEIGTSPDNLKYGNYQPAFDVWHRFTITNLAPETQYYYQITVWNEDGLGSSVFNWFTTRPLSRSWAAVDAVLDYNENAENPITLAVTNLDPNNAWLRSFHFLVTVPPTNGVLVPVITDVLQPPDQLAFKYVANPGARGGDRFQYTALDKDLNEETLPATVTIVGIDTFRRIQNSRTWTWEDTATGVLLGEESADGTVSPLYPDSVSGGILTGTPPFVVWAPPTNFFGELQMDFHRADGSRGVIYLDVAPVNDPPVISPSLSYSITEDSELLVVPDGTDPEGTTLSYTIVNRPPQAHSITWTGNGFLVKPLPNFYGNIRFTIQGSDGEAYTEYCYISVAVNPIDDPPLAQNQNVYVRPDDAALITLRTVDADGGSGPSTFEVVTEPVHGQLAGTPPNLVYTALPDFIGADTFEFSVRSEGGAVSRAAVSITVTPFAESQNDLWDVSQGATITGTSGIRSGFVASDIFGTSLSQLEPGQTVFPDGRTNGFIHYLEWRTPDPVLLTAFNLFAAGNPWTGGIQVREFSQFILKAKRNSTDAFTTIYSFTPTHPYTFVEPLTRAVLSAELPQAIPAQYFRAEFVQLNTGLGVDGPRIIELDGFGSITGHPPDAVDQSISVAKGSSIPITLSATNPDGGSDFSFEIVSSPKNGTLTGTIPDVIYTPNGLPGADVFEFSVRNNFGVSTGRVNITVTVQESRSDLWDISNGTSITGTSGIRVGFQGNDIFGTSLSSLEPANTVFPDDRPNGYIHYVEWKTVNPILLNAFNLFAAGTPSSSGMEREFSQFTLKAKRRSTDEFTTIYSFAPTHPYTYLDSTSRAIVSADLPEAVEALFFRAEFVQLNAGRTFNGPRVIELDGFGSRLSGPIAIEQSVSLLEDSSLAITLNANPAADSTVYGIVSAPAHGTLSGTPPNVLYTPAPNFFGTDFFEFSAGNESGEFSRARVSITVTAVNDAPVAVSLNIAGQEDAPLPFALRGTDIDGNALTFNIVTQPQHGTLSSAPGGLIYTPNKDYFGEDAIGYRASDGTAQSAIANVRLTIAPVDDAPLPRSQTIATSEDQSVPFTLTADDVDGGPLTFAIVTPPANGTLAGQIPNLTYTPRANFFGTDGVRFSASNGSGTGNQATVTINVAPVNDTPTANPVAVSTAFNTPVSVALSGSDIENSPLTYNIVTAPANGTLTGTAPNLTFTPTAGWSGTTSFTYTVNDGAAASAPATVIITVNAASLPMALHYNFDALSGTVVNDNSGSGNNGTLRNNPIWTAGMIGAGAMSFPQSNDYIEVPASPSLADLDLQGGGGMTISFWMNTPTLANGIVVTKGIDSGVRWEINMNSSGRLTFFRDYSGTTDLNLRFESQVIAGQWQHFTFTWTGTPGTESVRLYRNGVLRPLSFGSAGSGTKTSDAAKAINIGGISSGYGVNASIDDFRLYNRVLSADEIASLAAAR